MAREYLGEFEITVLAALLQLENDAYGKRIRQEIERRTGRSVAIGAIYTTLRRLEEKGYVASRMGAPTPERGGRRKRSFRVLTSGVRTLERSVRSLARMVDGVVVEGGFA